MSAIKVKKLKYPMGQKGNKTREEFINNAFLIVEQEGVGNLTTRNLYAKTGLGQSSFYSQFKNLDNLILEINNLTLKKIQTLLNESIEKGKRQNKTYKEIIGLIALAFIEFAENNYNLWCLLFEYKLVNNDSLPEWFSDEVENVFSVVVRYIEGELGDKKESKAFGAILWASLHGLINLHHNNKLKTVTTDHPRELSKILVENLVRVPNTPVSI